MCYAHLSRVFRRLNMLPVSRFQHFLCPGSDNEWTSNNTLYNVCAVPWGVLSTMGGVQYRGGYHEYRGGVQYRGGYHDKCGGYLEYRGGYHEYRGEVILSTMGDVLKFEYRGGISWWMWGDIMSTVGVFSTVGYSNNKTFPPTVLNTLHGTHDIPQVHHDIPPRYWTSPTVLKVTPTVLMISPTVLNIPHGTQGIPHIYHDIPHGTEHPHGTQDIPPRYSWYPPTVLNTPTVLITPHGTAHTLYRVNKSGRWNVSKVYCQ